MSHQAHHFRKRRSPTFHLQFTERKICTRILIVNVPRRIHLHLVLGARSACFEFFGLKCPRMTCCHIRRAPPLDWVHIWRYVKINWVTFFINYPTFSWWFSDINSVLPRLEERRNEIFIGRTKRGDALYEGSYYRGTSRSTEIQTKMPRFAEKWAYSIRTYRVDHEFMDDFKAVLIKDQTW